MGSIPIGGSKNFSERDLDNYLFNNKNNSITNDNDNHNHNHNNNNNNNNNNNTLLFLLLFTIIIIIHFLHIFSSITGDIYLNYDGC